APRVLRCFPTRRSSDLWSWRWRTAPSPVSFLWRSCMNTGAIARFVLRHKAIVALAWVALLVASIGLMPRALGALSEDFSLQDSESTQANGRILGQFDGVGGIAHPLVLVVDLPEGTTVDDPMVQQDLDRVFGKVAEARPDARIASYASTGDDVFVSD